MLRPSYIAAFPQRIQKAAQVCRHEDRYQTSILIGWVQPKLKNEQVLWVVLAIRSHSITILTVDLYESAAGVSVLGMDACTQIHVALEQAAASPSTPLFQASSASGGPNIVFFTPPA